MWSRDEAIYSLDPIEFKVSMFGLPGTFVRVYVIGSEQSVGSAVYSNRNERKKPASPIVYSTGSANTVLVNKSVTWQSF